MTKENRQVTVEGDIDVKKIETIFTEKETRVKIIRQNQRRKSPEHHK